MSKTLTEAQFEKIKNLLDWVTRIDTAEVEVHRYTQDVTLEGRHKREGDYSKEAAELLLELNYI